MESERERVSKKARVKNRRQNEEILNAMAAIFCGFKRELLIKPKFVIQMGFEIYL